MQFLLASTSHYVGIVIDLAVVILLLTFAFLGYHKGFLKSLIALSSTTVVIIIAINFANPFAKLINSIYDFTSLIAQKLAPSIERISSVYSMSFPSGMSGTEFYNSYIDASSTNTILKRFFKFALKGYSSGDIEGLKVAEVLAGSIASIIMTIIAGILLFIIIKIALSFISRLFDNISRTRVLGGLNKILGFAFGALQGATIVVTFVVITICVSFVPKLNQKIYPLVQDDTKVVKVIYNTTDRLIDKYFIKSDTISKWINNLWDNRYLKKQEKEETIADKAEVLDNTQFVQENEKYTASYNLTLSSEEKYFRINKFIEGKTSANVIITLTFDGEHTLETKLYKISELNTEVTKDGTSTETNIILNNVTYEDWIVALKGDAEITVSVKIEII